MVEITVTWANDELEKFGDRLTELRLTFPKVLPRIINQVGGRARTQVVRALTKQTGLPRQTIEKAIGNPGRAHAGSLSYEMRTRGGNIRLKYLRPHETEEGVVAYAFGKATLYPGAFLKGGSFPNRKDVPKFDGHAMVRNRSSGRDYTFARSGVRIPVEMTTGATKAAFEHVAMPLLQARVEAALRKLIG